MTNLELSDQQIRDRIEAGERALRTFDIEIWETRQKLEDLKAEQVRRTIVKSEPPYVRAARLAQQAHDRRNPVQLEVGVEL